MHCHSALGDSAGVRRSFVFFLLFDTRFCICVMKVAEFEIFLINCELKPYGDLTDFLKKIQEYWLLIKTTNAIVKSETNAVPAPKNPQ